MPGSVQERSREHIAGRVGRKGAYTCLIDSSNLIDWLHHSWSSSLLPHEPDPLQLMTRALPSELCYTPWTNGTLPTSLAETTALRTTTIQKEWRIGVVHLVNVLGFVWSLTIVLLLSEPLEVMGEIRHLQIQKRHQNELCSSDMTETLLVLSEHRPVGGKFYCWNLWEWWFWCYKSQLEVWQVASGSNVILGI